MRWATLAMAMLACGGGSSAGDAGPMLDSGRATDAAALASDGAPPLASVDFAITGCAEFADPGDAGTPACVGEAPLTLGFVAVSASPLEAFRWRFGDLSNDAGPTTEPAPLHTFVLPGVYDVTLSAAGPGGAAMVIKPGAVVTTSASSGKKCSLDAQCAGECICDDSDCPAGLAPGICTADCSVDPCDDGVCVDLAPTAPGDPQAWQGKRCLPDCSVAPCPAHLTCQVLLGASGTFETACFAPGVLAAIGGSCVDALGDAQDARCATGQCSAEGARGMCSADCSPGTCPDGSACAVFAGGLGSICVARCSESSCDSDPWLACEAPGGGGAKSFAIDETADPAGYCAPKKCTMPSECGQDGTCVAGFCSAL